VGKNSGPDKESEDAGPEENWLAVYDEHCGF
jgi:hypothetical protein